MNSPLWRFRCLSIEIQSAEFDHCLLVLANLQKKLYGFYYADFGLGFRDLFQTR